MHGHGYRDVLPADRWYFATVSTFALALDRWLLHAFERAMKLPFPRPWSQRLPVNSVSHPLGLSTHCNSRRSKQVQSCCRAVEPRREFPQNHYQVSFRYLVPTSVDWVGNRKINIAGCPIFLATLSHTATCSSGRNRQCTVPAG